MTTKKTTFGAGRPSQSAKPSADAWVETRSDGGKMKRLTIDITEDLHRRLKMSCASEGKKIADVVRELLIQKYG